LAYAAWLSVHGKDEQQRRLAAKFVELILHRAEEAGDDVYEKVKKIIEEGMLRGSQTLERFEGVAEVNGKTYVVKVKGWSVKFDEGRDGKTLLRIKITAEVGRVEGEHIVERVESEYTITYGRYGRNNAAMGRAYARADVDAERFAAVIKALTGREPKVYRRSDGGIEIVCTRAHLEDFMRFVELADDIERWLEETGR
jgi:hypothetical protein